jgi:polyvinyl alcohol dehydrogenase (cytochrome)
MPMSTSPLTGWNARPNASRPALAAWAIGVALAGFTATSQAAVTRCTDTIDTASPLLSNSFAFNSANTRNQASKINAGNVGQLKPAYTHVAEGAKDKRGAPVVTEQALYFIEGLDLVAANRATGCEYWRYTGKRQSALAGGTNAMRNSVYFVPAAAPRPAAVLVGDFFGNVYSVNAQTGKEVWKAFMGTDANRHMITGSFQVHEGTVYVPVATKEVMTTIGDLFSNCCSSHGMLRAVDVATGKVKWTYHTTANAAPVSGTSMRGPNGASIWATPMIDADNQAVVVGTGQNLSQPTTDTSDAIISLDMATGKPKWIFQAVKGDYWNLACVSPGSFARHCTKSDANRDFDFGASPILAPLPTGGKAILAGGKNGVVYSLNPKTGALNWSTKLGVGGTLGGIHWGMAIDGTKVYASVTDIVLGQITSLGFSQLLAINATLGKYTVPSVGAKPGIYALDLLTGKVAWEKHYKHVYQGNSYDALFSAALSVTNDVLMAVDLRGQLKALRTSNGDELFSFDTAVSVVDVNGASGKGGTADSVGPVPAGSDVYVNSGYSSFGTANAWLGGEGNALFVLRLP